MDWRDRDRRAHARRLHAEVARRIRDARVHAIEQGRDPAAAERALRLESEIAAYDAIARHGFLRWLLDPEHDEDLLYRAITAAERAHARARVAQSDDEGDVR